ncbi:related to hsp90 chaperone complex associated protein CNS1 [Fusarium fujikuroi IMI 58289]|uniref:Related to hsp90 chaperone complex associated protein CNS1 n=1 Tax=Gibberella fujikuroi (strain CBS 195.34 / IMI 58289 / NRRL A-6831) TaxID=1279085 RepID=S0DU93_GIBF5|nr:related to hsp90 chaperone complex associated protein CNS1 [Fusarium fujikuroi IMI 58289]CCT64118.1 related to hsp90 chaperone complex associated protein CNS1 [Fusarium fujikuroi IMI 58289]
MKIEEITDKMDEAMKLEQVSPQPNTSATEATKPELPPARAIASGKTVDEVWEDLNKSPLFMTDLDANEENEDIAALQALAYEGTPLENGQEFKERGNEYFKLKSYADAKEFYGKGIAILAGEERKRARGEQTKNQEGVIDTEEEIQKQRETLEALYVNRAACHLAVKNYRSCWLDCAAALRLNPRNIKAYSAEADDVCARGLSLDENNASLRAVADDIIKRAKEIDVRRKRDAEREAKEKRRALLIKAALRARNIPTRTTSQPPEMEDAGIALLPDPDDPRSTLAFPTVLLYPLHLESDFIKAFEETHSLDDHLSYIFPLPWDKEGVYTTTGVEAFVETTQGGLLKMGKRVPLLKVLGTGKVEVVDEVVRIFVVPKDKAEAWTKEHKAKRAAEKGETS